MVSAIVAAVPLAAIACAVLAGSVACYTISMCDSMSDKSDFVCMPTRPDMGCQFLAGRIARKEPPLRSFFQTASSVASWSPGAITSDALVVSELALVQYRGACERGMHQLVAFGVDACVPQTPFPSALAHDAMLAGADLSISRAACGAWSDDAQLIGVRPGSTYTFGSTPLISASMWRLAATRSSSSDGTVASRPASKMLSTCRRAVSGGVDELTVAMRLAHAALLEAGGDLRTLHDVARHAGVFASYACPSMVSVGLQTQGASLQTSIYNGEPPSYSEVARALDALGAGKTAAAEILEHLAGMYASGCKSSDWVTHETLEMVLSGVIGRPLTLETTSKVERDLLTHLASLLCVVGAAPITGTSEDAPLLDERSTALASSLFSAMAAECAATVVDRMRGPNDGDTSELVDQLSLGRTSRWNDALPSSVIAGKAFSPPSDAEWKAATTRTWRHASSLAPSSAALRLVVGSPDACFDTLVYAAVDVAEASLFDAVVPELLYTRLESLVQQITASVAKVVTEPPFSHLFVEPSLVAETVLGVTFRIPGAPATTWAGRSYASPQPIPRRAAGVATAFLDQQQQGIRDSVGLALGMYGEPCDVPPLFDSTEPNAYYLHGSNCVFITPGLLRMPIADAAYDEESLRSRIGFIIAHELGHASLVTGRRSGAYLDLLEYYIPATVYEEGLADIIATSALLRLAPAQCNRTLLHVAQLFCATPGGAQSSSHPTGNARPDTLHRTVVEKLGLSCDIVRPK